MTVEPNGKHPVTIARLHRFWSKAQLARAAGTDWDTIDDIEKGERTPRDTTKERIASALNMPVGVLFPEEEPAA